MLRVSRFSPRSFYMSFASRAMKGVIGTEVVGTLDSAHIPVFRWLPFRGSHLRCPSEPTPVCRRCPPEQRPLPRTLPSSPSHRLTLGLSTAGTWMVTTNSPRPGDTAALADVTFPGDSLKLAELDIMAPSQGAPSPHRLERGGILTAVCTPST